MPVVGDLDPGQDRPVVGPQRHQHGVDAVPLGLLRSPSWSGRAALRVRGGGPELDEHRGHPTVARRVADVVLARGLGGRVDHELVGGRVVGGGGVHRLHVGTVTGLRHGEATRQRQVHHTREVLGVLLGAPERLDGAAEQTPLHAALDLQREVGEGEHLEGDDRPADVPAAALGDREAVHSVALGGQDFEHLPDPRTVGLRVEARFDAKIPDVLPGPDPVPQRVPPAVEGAPDGVRGVGADAGRVGSGRGTRRRRGRHSGASGAGAEQAGEDARWGERLRRTPRCGRRGARARPRRARRAAGPASPARRPAARRATGRPPRGSCPRARDPR